MRSRPPKYTQRPGAEILVLRRAAARFSPDGVQTHPRPRIQIPPPIAGQPLLHCRSRCGTIRQLQTPGPQAGRFSPHGVETPPCGTRPPSPPLRTESIGEIDVLAMSVMGNSRLAECFVWNYCMRASDTAARCFALFEGRGGPKP